MSDITEHSQCFSSPVEDEQLSRNSHKSKRKPADEVHSTLLKRQKTRHVENNSEDDMDISEGSEVELDEEQFGNATEARILLDEQAILESKKNYPKIKELLALVERTTQGDNDSHGFSAAVSLCRIFIQFWATGKMTATKKQSNRDAVVADWLQVQLEQYEDFLLQLLGHGEFASTALILALRLLKARGQATSDDTGGNYPVIFLTKIVKMILYVGTEGVMAEFVENYMKKFQDLRYYSFGAVEAVLAKGREDENADTLFDNAFAILFNNDEVPKDGEKFTEFYLPPPKKKNHRLYSVTKLKLQAQAAWLALIKTFSNAEQRKQLLKCLSTEMVPWFVDPERLSDFLTDSYHAGGSLALLALSGVYSLIQERNLDYPSFYEKLYSLLTPDTINSKYRSRYFRLLETFLSSTHLPATLIASFIKRMSRLALSAPPAAIVAIVPFMYNLFKKHPQTTFMMHREVHDPALKADIEQNGFTDPFDPYEPDPLCTRAIDSCIWEIVQLQSHYDPDVSTISKIVSQPFTKESYQLEDFLDHSYQSLVKASLQKPIKKEPVIEYIIPTAIFTADDNLPQHQPNLLVQLWDFKPLDNSAVPID